MGRLFDSGKRERNIQEARLAQATVRRRAEEADQAIKEHLELTEASQKLGEKLAGLESVRPVHYESYRARGSRWNIEHAQVGPDYVYQLFPLRPPNMHWKDVIAHFINAMDSIFPRSVTIRYVPPSERFQLKYYTIRVGGVTELPGWEGAARDRALRSLSAVDAWTVAAPADEGS